MLRIIGRTCDDFDIKKPVTLEKTSNYRLFKCSLPLNCRICSRCEEIGICLKTITESSKFYSFLK